MTDRARQGNERVERDVPERRISDDQRGDEDNNEANPNDANNNPGRNPRYDSPSPDSQAVTSTTSEDRETSVVIVYPSNTSEITPPPSAETSSLEEDLPHADSPEDREVTSTSNINGHGPMQNPTTQTNASISTLNAENTVPGVASISRQNPPSVQHVSDSRQEQNINMQLNETVKPENAVELLTSLCEKFLKENVNTTASTNFNFAQPSTSRSIGLQEHPNANSGLFMKPGQALTSETSLSTRQNVIVSISTSNIGQIRVPPVTVSSTLGITSVQSVVQSVIDACIRETIPSPNHSTISNLQTGLPTFNSSRFPTQVQSSMVSPSLVCTPSTRPPSPAPFTSRSSSSVTVTCSEEPTLNTLKAQSSTIPAMPFPNTPPFSNRSPASSSLRSLTSSTSIVSPETTSERLQVSTTISSTACLLPTNTGYLVSTSSSTNLNLLPTCSNRFASPQSSLKAPSPTTPKLTAATSKAHPSTSESSVLNWTISFVPTFVTTTSTIPISSSATLNMPRASTISKVQTVSPTSSKSSPGSRVRRQSVAERLSFSPTSKPEVQCMKDSESSKSKIPAPPPSLLEKSPARSNLRPWTVSPSSPKKSNLRTISNLPVSIATVSVSSPISSTISLSASTSSTALSFTAAESLVPTTSSDLSPRTQKTPSQPLPIPHDTVAISDDTKQTECDPKLLTDKSPTKRHANPLAEEAENDSQTPDLSPTKRVKVAVRLPESVIKLAMGSSGSAEEVKKDEDSKSKSPSSRKRKGDSKDEN